MVHKKLLNNSRFVKSLDNALHILKMFFFIISISLVQIMPLVHDGGFGTKFCFQKYSHGRLAKNTGIYSFMSPCFLCIIFNDWFYEPIL